MFYRHQRGFVQQQIGAGSEIHCQTLCGKGIQIGGLHWASPHETLGNPQMGIKTVGGGWAGSGEDPREDGPLNQLRITHLGSQRLKQQAPGLQVQGSAPGPWLICPNCYPGVFVGLCGSPVSLTPLLALGTISLLLGCLVQLRH